jgi:hypothetical protein
MVVAVEDNHHKELELDMQSWLLAAAYREKMAPAVGTAEQQVEELHAVAARKALQCLVVIATLMEPKLDSGH